MKKSGVIQVVAVIVFVILAVGLAACSSAGPQFTVTGIKTKGVGFSGMSSGGISVSDVYLEGKVGRKTCEICLKTAFEGCSTVIVSGEYESSGMLSFDPAIAFLQVKTKNGEGTETEFTVAAGTVFDAVVDGGNVTLLPPVN